MEAGMLALRSRRMIVTTNDMDKALKVVMLKRQEGKHDKMFVWSDSAVFLTNKLYWL